MIQTFLFLKKMCMTFFLEKNNNIDLSVCLSLEEDRGADNKGI